MPVTIFRWTGPTGNTVDHLMADRKFVGDEWSGYPNANAIYCHIRTRGNFHIVRHSREFKASSLLNDLKLGESKHLDGILHLQPALLLLRFESQEQGGKI
jgi:hypothetical protein